MWEVWEVFEDFSVVIHWHMVREMIFHIRLKSLDLGDWKIAGKWGHIWHLSTLFFLTLSIKFKWSWITLMLHKLSLKYSYLLSVSASTAKLWSVQYLIASIFLNILVSAFSLPSVVSLSPLLARGVCSQLSGYWVSYNHHSFLSSG